MSDLYQLVAETLGGHRLEVKSRTDACPDYPGFTTWHDGCICGWVGRYLESDEQFDEHLAQAVGDLLIDLAGTGRLLASIDRIARDFGPEEL